MPSYPCPHPTCTIYLKERGQYCPAHAAQGKAARARRSQHYDLHQRDPAAKSFYNSAAWQRARAKRLTENPVCQRCQRVFAKHVHHIKPLAECSEAEKTALENLKALCQPCHNSVEAEAAHR